MEVFVPRYCTYHGLGPNTNAFEYLDPLGFMLLNLALWWTEAELRYQYHPLPYIGERVLLIAATALSIV